MQLVELGDIATEIFLIPFLVILLPLQVALPVQLEVAQIVCVLGK